MLLRVSRIVEPQKIDTAQQKQLAEGLAQIVGRRAVRRLPREPEVEGEGVAQQGTVREEAASARSDEAVRRLTP